MTRPKVSELFGCQRLGEGRFAYAFEWQGQCVKLYRPKAYEGGDYSDPERTVQAVLDGVQRCQEADIPVLPVLDYWQEGDSWLVIQPLAEYISPEMWYDLHEIGRDLAMRAYVAGVADVLPSNVMWAGDNLVVVDTGEVFDEDEDGYYWTCLDDGWRPRWEVA
ncbi:MAG: hypothetical protein GY832_08460 [Chloroflexi bacterium]|nr:hypothetical protein [Chloroflexota bacterium]